jgi:peptidoglycan/xylan/chitin deacetylase (PgdA/CDA1 family)
VYNYSLRSEILGPASNVAVALEKTLNIPLPSPMVLAYHTVSRDGLEVDVTPEKFSAQLSFLSRHYQFVNLDSITAHITGQKKLHQPSVALTFDDGYQDIMRYAQPLMTKLRIPAAIFILGSPQNVNRRELDNSKPLLTSAQVLSLLHQGWTIGCHTSTHANLTDSRIDLVKEIFSAKKNLENLTQVKINHFAYPKGLFTNSAIRLVKQAGFKDAFTTHPGSVTANSDLFLIPRTEIDWTFEPSQFKGVFSQTGQLYLKLKQLL